MAGLLIPADCDPVAAELRRWASTPFDWRTDNCGLSVLFYVEQTVARLLQPRPLVKGRRHAARMVRRAGGFQALCAGAMARLGCAPTDVPARGDVGLVELASGLTAAICLGGDAWAARGDHAAVIEHVEPVAAWRVVCHRR